MLLHHLPIWLCLFTGQTPVYASLQKKEGYSGGLWNILPNILRNDTMCGISSREIKLRLKIEFPFAFLFKNKILMPGSRILVFLYLMNSLQIKASSGVMPFTIVWTRFSLLSDRVIPRSWLQWLWKNASNSSKVEYNLAVEKQVMVTSIWPVACLLPGLWLNNFKLIQKYFTVN